MRSLLHHGRVYWYLLSNSFKFILAYRFNLFIQLFYTSIYYFMQFSVVTLVFNQTSSLGSWGKEEALLLFWVYIFLYNIADALFNRGAFIFMNTGIVMGEFDQILTKPVNKSLMVMFGMPRVYILPISVVAAAISLHSFLGLQLPWINMLSFSIASCISLLCAYFILSLYATSAFFVTKSVQIYHTFEKTTDFSQYPTTIFPKVVELTFMTIFPVALFGYLPTLFLLGRSTIHHVGWLAAILVVSFILQKYMWHIGIKRYSSASS